MTFAEKLKNNYRCGKCTIVENKNKRFAIFSTPDLNGCLRYSTFYESLNGAERNIGDNCGWSDEDLNNVAQEESWRIVGTIDFSELGGEGYKEGEKVRILPDSKEKCLKSGIDWNTYKKEILKKGFGLVERKEGSEYRIDGAWFPSSAIEPFYEDKVEEMTLAAVIKELGREIKIVKE